MKKLVFLLLAVILVSGLVFSGCGGKETTTAAATTAAATTAPTKTTPAAPTPKYGNTLTMLMSSGSLSNAAGWPPIYTGGEYTPGQIVLDSLLRSDNEGIPYPWLATSYKLADDKLSITFTLNKGVKFQDGSDFNAKVAQWNLQLLIDAKKQSVWKSIDIIDDYTIRVNFTQWANTILRSFCDNCYMVSKTAYEAHGSSADWMRDNPVGTGPFKFVSFQKDVSYIATRNPDYWAKDAQGRQLPYLDGVKIIFVADPMTQKAEMLAGGADLMQVIQNKDATELQAAGLTVMTQVSNTQCFVPDTAHTDSPYYKKEVREAVEYAIDREGLAKAFSYGYWTAPYQIPPPSSNVYNPNFTLARKYDPDKARALLTQAGYPNGFTTTLICAMASASVQDIFVAIQHQLSKVGITAELYFPDMGKWSEQGNTMVNILPVLAISDLGNYNASLWFLSPTSFLPFKNWKRTPEFVDLYNKTLASPAPDVNLMRAVTDYWTTECQVIPAYVFVTQFTMQKYVMNTGIFTRGVFSYFNVEQTWLNK